MKVVCNKGLSDSTLFTDGKVYKCYHIEGQDGLRIRWIKDDKANYRCVIPGEPSAHLVPSFIPFFKSEALGIFNLLMDDLTPSQMIYAEVI